MPPSATPGIRVLVVDDHPDVRDMMVAFLTLRGFIVDSAADGSQAVELVRTVHPDIVLMDLSLPGVNGWEVTRILKNDAKTRTVRIIAVTAHALEREVAAARAAGCDGVLSKPFDLDALADALPNVLTHGAAALQVPGLALQRPAGRTLPFQPRAPEPPAE